MSGVLIDTHIFLWYVSGDASLAESHRAVIASSEMDVSVSVVSFWECIVKADLGKLNLRKPFWKTVAQYADQHLISVLPLEQMDLAFLEELPSIHRDPFDRLLVCQALRYNIPLLTDDTLIKEYPVRIL